MSPEEFRAQLEYDLDWRMKELALLTNQLSNISEEDKKIYCKALLVMLYSHFEGFCKEAFKTYVRLINEEKIIRSKATEYIVASSLGEEFHDIQYHKNIGNNCCDIFNISSNETKFKKYFIRAHFIRMFDQILDQEIDISERITEKIVDTKSNLTLDVLSNILYRLGLPYNQFDAHEGLITTLLTRRGAYAHGNKVEGISEKDYKIIEKKVFDIISALVTLLTESAKNRSYLKVVF